MKTLQNKAIDIPQYRKDSDQEHNDYGDLLRYLLSVKTGPGFSVMEMRIRLRLLEITEKGGETFNFEDQDAKDLQKIAEEGEKFKVWAVMGQDIINLMDDIGAMGKETTDKPNNHE